MYQACQQNQMHCQPLEQLRDAGRQCWSPCGGSEGEIGSIVTITKLMSVGLEWDGFLLGVSKMEWDLAGYCGGCQEGK